LQKICAYIFVYLFLIYLFTTATGIGIYVLNFVLLNYYLVHILGNLGKLVDHVTVSYSFLVLLAVLHFNRVPIGGLTDASPAVPIGARALGKVVESIARNGQNG